MLDYIKGTLQASSPGQITLEANGLGYHLLIPLSSFARLPNLGSPLQLFTALVIREDAHTLFGFLDKEERSLFDALRETSGIGPKSALAIVGHLEVEALHLAVAENNITLLCKVPGIGKKSAERLIIEMRDKVGKVVPRMPGASGLVADATSALVNLGYNPLHVQKALKTILDKEKRPLELAPLITAALRAL
jgi:holliday junction DNA helicase RuvA